ncbi:MAG TPA: ABC transporter permease [Candidatus Eisenbacteria bacterium]|nr:ABC transporter permease [Candidatus Eisenbacteria bacterium]
MLQDLRYALRQLKKNPGFAAVAVLTLALGIAAITTVFTWANAVLFNPWPQISQATQIRALDAGIHGDRGYTLHYIQLQYLRQHHQGFSELTAHEMIPVDLSGGDSRPQRYWSGIVASNYFQFLGVRPYLGRFFTPHDDRAYGSAPEVVLSYDLWRSRFQSDPGIVGRTITVNRQPLTVIGVAPEHFTGIYGGLAQSLWMPFSELQVLSSGKPDPLMQGKFGMEIVARLRPGTSDDQAAAELHSLAHQFATEQNSSYYNQWDMFMSDPAHMQRGFFGTLAQIVPLLLGAAVLLLLLVYTNVGVLLVQRSSRRVREMAIRSSLGASRTRLVRQLVTETAVIAVVAGMAGWLTSLLLSRALYALLPSTGISFVFNLRPDLRILAFVLGMTIVTVLACGLLPARQVLRISQVSALHDGAVSVVGSRTRKRRNIVLSVQLGICFVVLVVSGLLVRTFWKVLHRDPGFSVQNVLVASLDLARAGYNEDKGFAFQRSLLEKLRTVPGVGSASLTSYVPMGLSGGGNVRDVAVAGYQPAKDESMSIVVDSVAPDFFKTMRVPIVQGREFSDHDTADAPCVAVINEGMARKYWPKGDALGGHIQVSKKSCEIVGINRNYIYRNASWDTGDPVVFLSLFQDYQSWFSLVLRGSAPNQNLLPALDATVASLDSTLPINDIETLRDHIATSYYDTRTPAQLLSVYGICSLLVATLGIYAGLGYSVVERTKEFALRVALGADRPHIFRMVLSETTRIAAGGLLLGAVGAFFAVRLIKSLLFGVSPFDPVSALGAVLLLVATAAFAGWLPARRAAAVEPMQALRSE